MMNIYIYTRAHVQKKKKRKIYSTRILRLNIYILFYFVVPAAGIVRRIASDFQHL